MISCCWYDKGAVSTYSAIVEEVVGSRELLEHLKQHSNDDTI